MQFLALIAQFFKIVMFFLNLWKEKDAEKARKKAEVGMEIVDAFKQTDKKIRASRLNSVAGRIGRMRG